MKAVGIEWDVDSDKELEWLPKEMEIPPEITDVDEVSDYLSDTTGYCHKGFKIEEVQDACPVCGTLVPTDDRMDFIPVEEIHFCYHCGANLTENIF